jgi:hypothetical protein
MFVRKNTNALLAKLTKKLLTHSEQHKTAELKYEEDARKRRLYFHNWLFRMSPIIKMFPQTASVLDADNNIVEFPSPDCVGNKALVDLFQSGQFLSKSHSLST